ncbi:MAG: SDR family NAD(P)-dependent oxidoreductase [Alphaproteobacteria bacterium]
MDFSGRHVVVTGATGALGSAVVARLVEAGATCHIPNHDASKVARFPYRDHPSVRIAAGIDLADEAAAVRFFAALPGLWASIHVAGGFDMGPIASISLDAAMAQMRMNYATCFLSCREAVRRMRGQGGGRIVNVAARPALEPRQGAGMTAYTASKAAVAAFTQALAEEVATEGIWVNAVVPSIIDTPANRQAMPKTDPSRWPKPAEIAETIVYLASSANAVTRGALVSVYGAR